MKMKYSDTWPGRLSNETLILCTHKLDAVAVRCPLSPLRGLRSVREDFDP